MKDRNRQLVRYSFYDQTAMQNHFEKMALEGWLIEKITPYYLQFRRIEPEKLHIAVTYFPDASEFDPCPSDKQQMMEDFAAKDGWRLLTRLGQMQVFCNNAEKPIPIDTDPVTQVETIFRAMKKNIIQGHLILLILSIYQLAFNGYRMFSDTVDFLSTPYLLASLPVWLLILLAEINEILTCFCWYRKAKAAATNNGVFVPIKTNRFITFTLLLSSAFLIISTITLPGEVRIVSISWLVVVIGIILLGQVLKQKLKKIGASRGINYIVTVLITILLTIAFFSGMIFYIMRYGLDNGRKSVGSYLIYGSTFKIYDEPMPLYVEDMMEIGDSEWSRERNVHNETILLAKSEYRQHHIQGGPEDLKDLEYTIIDVKIPTLYDTVKQSMLNEKQDEIHGDYLFINHYEPVDTVTWNATEAYQLHWSGSILNTYLVCWDNLIVEIRFYWQPTPEQIAVVVDKLKNE